MTDTVVVDSQTSAIVSDQDIEVVTIAPSNVVALDIEDSGTTILANAGGINFNANLDASDDGDGTVTVDVGSGVMLVDGSRAMTGALDMGSNNVNNAANLVDLGSAQTISGEKTFTDTININDAAQSRQIKLFNSGTPTNDFGLIQFTGGGVIKLQHWDDSASSFQEIAQFEPGGTAVFQAAPAATGNPLRYDELLENGGTVPKQSTASWTPVIVGSTTAGTNSYTTQEAYVTTEGDLTFVWGEINLDGTAGALDSTGNLSIQTLPETVANLQGVALTIRARNIGMSSGEILIGFAPANGTEIQLRKQSNTGDSPFTDSDGTDSMRVWFSAVYQKA